MFVGMGANGAGGYNLTDSLRFRSSASAYLSRTPATASNRQTWTWSAWVKRGALGPSQNLFACDIPPNDENWHQISFNTTNQLDFLCYIGGAAGRLKTTQVFRDLSAWYHIVIVWDTTNATSTDRMRIYVNGDRITSFETTTYPSLNLNGIINSADVHTIGSLYYNLSNTQYFDGYLTEVNFVDGQALDPTYFGEYNEDTGVWQPKKYTGTYGTNGFYLKGRGTDNSGNGNNWTENNFNTSNSALTTYDIMTDVPTLTDEDTANFCTLNPLIPVSTTTAINGNLGMSGYNPAGSMFGTVGVSSGKWYFEMVAYADAMSGISGTPNGGAFPGAASNAYTWDSNNATKYSNSTGASYGSATSNGDIVGVAFDLDSGSIVFYKNGVSQGTAYTFTPSGIYFPAFRNGSSTNTSVNFGQRPFAYTPPTGYLKLNTFNLPDSSIVDGSQYMNTITYTGDGVDGRVISGYEFAPDLVWSKSRSFSRYHELYDTVRGATNRLMSNLTDAEAVNLTGLKSFTSDGYTFGTHANVNNSGESYVNWSWRGSDSSAVSNTDGTITSQVSANPTAGFSVVTYDSNPSGTVGHGLSQTPELIIEKKRDATSDWIVGLTIIDGSYDYMRLNTTAAAAASAVAAPTSTVFTPNMTSNSMIAYCFHSVDGYSSLGSYTGNGSTDGTFVYTGFRPAYIMIKRTNGVANWVVLDAARDTYNAGGLELFPNTNGTENNNSPEIDFLSNGVKLRWTYSGTNASGGTYIYMAFASNPFKNSLAR